MVFCSKCGSENPNGSAYCYKCGTKLLTEIPDRKGISQPVVTGKYPAPKADERAEKPRYQDIYHGERAVMNEAVRDHREMVTMAPFQRAMSSVPSSQRGMIS